MSTIVLDRAAEVFSAETPGGLLLSPEAPSCLQAADWRAETRSAAWRRFESLPMPVRQEESWRFSSLRALDLAGVRRSEEVTAAQAQELAKRSRGLDQIAGRMVFANDRLIDRGIPAPELSGQGVLWLPIQQAAEQYRALFQKHFMQEEPRLGSQKFAALHEAAMRDGAFLYVPKGVEVTLPLEAHYWLHGDSNCCFPHTLIVAEENSKVTVVDYFNSTDEETAGFACGVNDLWLGPGAKVTYVNVQRWNVKTRAVQINSTIVGRDASAVALTANFGGAYVRNESVSHLRGAGGRSDMLSISTVEGSREMDQRTLQIHEAPNTASDLLYKNALFEQSRTIFSGLIRVAPGAHFTDAYQKVRNLLLSDDAEANSAPGLEIEADNVRCTHGATSGQIEEEELFYLLSRGIPREAAQRLIVHGFLNEVLERLPNESIRTSLQEELEDRVH